MAALVKHGIFKCLSNKSTSKLIAAAAYATKAEKRKGIDRKIGPKIDSSIESIAAKGFLRPHKAYTPPTDVAQKIDTICQQLGKKGVLNDMPTRFELFTACAKQFDHSIPNSLLHTIQTVNDLKTFYQTPVETLTPLEAMRTMELPENLHVQYDYHRFHPDTDTMFNGQTAFNRSSTIVTGLKYKDKYKGHKQNQEWPYNS